MSPLDSMGRALPETFPLDKPEWGCFSCHNRSLSLEGEGRLAQG